MTTDQLVRQGMPIAARLAQEWNLVLGRPFSAATNCLVLEAGEDAVLRVPLVDEEAESGYYMQLAISGRGGAKVLRHDPDTRATLLARARPGTMLADAGLSLEVEVSAACSVVQRIKVDRMDSELRVETWYEPFLRIEREVAIPDDLLRLGQKTAGRLLSTMGRERVFHGDLHHFNLLKHEEGWVAIDPKGVRSEIEFEPAAFLRNPCTTIHSVPDLLVLMRTRIEAFAEGLGVSAERVRDWGIAQNVLSAWWDPPSERAATLRLVEAIRLAG